MILFYSSRIIGSLAGPVSNLEDSLYCLQTFRHLDVSFAYFNIEAIECTQQDIGLIQQTLSKLSVVYKLSWTRPTKLDCWREYSEKLVNAHTRDNIIFVFNHDHAFVSPFAEKLASDAQKFLESGERRIFYYNHTEENFVSTILPPVGFSYRKDGQFFVNEGNLNWIDGYFICSPGTFKSLVNSISVAPDYMPRIDWPGVSFEHAYYELGFSLEPYAVHLDGYDHFVSPSVADYREYVKSVDKDKISFDLKFYLLYAHHNCIVSKLKIPKQLQQIMWAFLSRIALKKISSTGINIENYKIPNMSVRKDITYTVKTLTFSRIIYFMSPRVFLFIRNRLKIIRTMRYNMSTKKQPINKCED